MFSAESVVEPTQFSPLPKTIQVPCINNKLYQFCMWAMFQNSLSQATIGYDS